MIRDALKVLWSRCLPLPAEARSRRSAEAVANRPLAEALSRFPPATDALQTHYNEAPLFVLSASWRSGSTLLQRLICSADQFLIWGEPYDRSAVIQRLADSLACFSPDWPPEDRYFDASKNEKLQDQWIANLYPPRADFQAAHRAFSDRLFAEPARRHGYTGWGLKEVRFGRREIDYLRWLYPYGKFILLVRDPRTAWLSYKGRIWQDKWPREPVGAVTRFARMWQRIASDFLQYADAERTLLIRYEDIYPDHASWHSLQQLVGARPDSTVLEQQIRGVPHKVERIPAVERAAIARICAETARQLGYDPG